jgi:flavin reductase (DIM6/NTAB) family NADH-FMN oxidoreductase RutF
MKKINPAEVPNSQIHKLLLGAIGPRPIAFASTVDEAGIPNLSPFSFFNFFGVNPTTLIFSPARRNRDNTVKHTYENVKVVPEVVINVVTFEMVNQVSLASSDFPIGTDEFKKAGFTKVVSDKVRPYRVKESPVQIECRVRQVIETGDGGGAGNLVICEVLMMHVDENILAEDGFIDQQKIRLVGRMGREGYTKAFGEALFKVEKPLDSPGIGIDALPEKIRFSKYLTGNDLGRLGNLQTLPGPSETETMRLSHEFTAILGNETNREEAIAALAKNYLEEGKPADALAVLMLL